MKKEYDKEAAKKKAKENLEKTEKMLLDGIHSLKDEDQYKEYLRFVAKLHHYSYNNIMLIMAQCPKASIIASYKQWNNMNRTVKKGEKGLMIITPRCHQTQKTIKDVNGDPILDDDGNEMTKAINYTTFGVGYVFDVSQTEGEDLPDDHVHILRDSVKNYDVVKKQIISISPLPVYFEKIEGEVNGYCSPGQRIVIDNQLPETQTIKTLIHEIAHAKFGHGIGNDMTSHDVKEAQAESVAFCVANYLGIDSSEYSFGYIAGWCGGQDDKILKENLSAIKKVAGEIIDAIENVNNVDDSISEVA
jgi:antirestriction protein ArdC